MFFFAIIVSKWLESCQMQRKHTWGKKKKKKEVLCNSPRNFTKTKLAAAYLSVMTFNLDQDSLPLWLASFLYSSVWNPLPHYWSVIMWSACEVKTNFSMSGSLTGLTSDYLSSAGRLATPLLWLSALLGQSVTRVLEVKRLCGFLSL